MPGPTSGSDLRVDRFETRFAAEFSGPHELKQFPALEAAVFGPRSSVVNPDIIRHRPVTVLRGYENAWQRPSQVQRLGDGTARRSGRILNRCIRLLSRPNCWPHFSVADAQS